MAWKFTIDDKSMLFDDLSMEDIDSVCTRHPESNWLTLYQSPAKQLGPFYSLLCVVARKLEVPSPDRPANMRDARALLRFVQHVDDDDLPTQFSEGGVPLETAVEQETTTSSTSTEPEDGLPKSPGDTA